MRIPNFNSKCFAVGVAFLAVALPAACQEKKLSYAEAMNAAVTKVEPTYPAVAKQLKIHGAVELEAVIAEDGTVGDVKIVAGNAVLTKAASEALRKWKFRPVEANGKPVKAIAPVKFNFE